MPFVERARACAERPTRVYVVRHGQSTYNAQGRFQGCCDEPVLTPAGVETAEAAAAYLRNAELDVVITSPLRRASHTAVLIYQRVWKRLASPSFLLDRRLREIELPLWEGRALSEVREEFPEQYRAWRERPEQFCMPGNHRPVAALFARAEEFWEHLLDHFAGCRILLVTHGGAGRALIGAALGMPQERFHGVQQCNGGLNVLEFPNHDRRQAEIRAINATDYLGMKLPKLKESKTGLRVVVTCAGGSGWRQMEHAGAVLDQVRLDAAFADCTESRETAAGLLGDGTNGGMRARISAEAPAPGVPAGSLKTVLWVVREESLRATLGKALGLRPGDEGRLRVAPFTFTVLHYAVPGAAPVVQAVNLHDVGRMTGADEAQEIGGQDEKFGRAYISSGRPGLH